MSNFFKRNLLTILTIVGIICGVIFGIGLKEIPSMIWTQRYVKYMTYTAELYIQFMQSCAVPLIMAIIITSICNTNIKPSKRIGTITILIYLLLAVLAVAEAFILVIFINPGLPFSSYNNVQLEEEKIVDQLLDLGRNMIPANIMLALVHREEFSIVIKDSNQTGGSEEWSLVSKEIAGTNFIGIIMFSIVFGICLRRLGSKGLPLTDTFVSLKSAAIIMSDWVYLLSPVAGFCLTASIFLERNDYAFIAGQFGTYILTLLLGYLLYICLIVPAVFYAFTKSNPIPLLKQHRKIIFKTSNNRVSPEPRNTAEDFLKVDNKIFTFTQSIGLIFNVIAAALVKIITVGFISQMQGVPLTVTSIIILSISAITGSLMALSIRQRGATIVLILMMMDCVLLSTLSIVYFLIIDWVVSWISTRINNFNDIIVAAIVNQFGKGDELIEPSNGVAVPTIENRSVYL